MLEFQAFARRDKSEQTCLTAVYGYSVISEAMNPNWQSILQVRLHLVSLASSLFPPWTATLTTSFPTLSLVLRNSRSHPAAMASFLPQTPSRKPSSPFSFSPSVYMNYAYSSPTPLPTNNLHVPTEISPYQYQLAHPGTRAPIPDASSALKTGCRDFGTLTVAETLLSVHSGVVSSNPLPTPPPSNPSSLARRLFVGEEPQTPSRLIWSSKHSSSSFVSPSKQQQAGSFGHYDRKSNGFASFSTSSMSLSSSFEQGSSQSSSQFTSVGWQEPRTPRSSERRKDINREKQGTICLKSTRHSKRLTWNCLGYMFSSSPGIFNTVSPRDFTRSRRIPRTPYRLATRSSFERHFDLASPGFDLRYSDTLHLSTPHGPQSIQTNDDSPVLRQSQQLEGLTFAARATDRRGDASAGYDDGSRLYASQNGSTTVVNPSSPIFSDTSDDFMSSDDELPSTSRTSRVISPTPGPSDIKRLDHDLFTARGAPDTPMDSSPFKSPAYSPAQSRRAQPPPFAFKDRRILNNPVTALTGPRASKSKAEYLISNIASAWSPRRRKSSGSASSGSHSGRPSTTLLPADDIVDSPLSSVPSTPASVSIATAPAHVTPSTTTRRRNTRLNAGNVFTIGTSPIGGRATRAQTRALAAVLRPFHDTQSPIASPTASSSTSRDALSSRKRVRDEAPSPVPQKRRKIHRTENLKTEIEATEGDADNEDESHENQRCDVGNRTFPSTVPLHPSFPAFYRKFAVPQDRFRYGIDYLLSVLDAEYLICTSASSLPGAVKNSPRSTFDLYTPRWVKGRGTTKVCCSGNISTRLI